MAGSEAALARHLLADFDPVHKPDSAFELGFVIVLDFVLEPGSAPVLDLGLV